MIQEIFNNILTSLFILFFGFLFADILKKFTLFILNELRLNKSLKGIIDLDLEKNISSLIYYIIFFSSIFLSLQNIGITGYLLLVWSLFIAIVFAISFILDLKDGLINIFYWNRFRNEIKKGSRIKTDVITGKIIKHSIFGITVIENKEEHYIPNKFLINGFIIN